MSAIRKSFIITLAGILISQFAFAKGQKAKDAREFEPTEMDLVVLADGEDLESSLRRYGFDDLKCKGCIYEYVLKSNGLTEEQARQLNTGDSYHAPFPKCFYGQHEYCKDGRTREKNRIFKVHGKHKDRSLELFVRELKSKEKVDVLDVGMGFGRFLLQLQEEYANSTFSGINKNSNNKPRTDREAKEIAEFFNIKLNAANSLRFYQQDLNEIKELPGEKFDLITSNSTIMYIKDKVDLIHQIYMKLKPGGRAYIHVNLFYINGADICQFFSKKSYETFNCMGRSLILTKTTRDLEFPKMRMTNTVWGDFPPGYKTHYEVLSDKE